MFDLFEQIDVRFYVGQLQFEHNEDVNPLALASVYALMFNI